VAHPRLATCAGPPFRPSIAPPLHPDVLSADQVAIAGRPKLGPCSGMGSASGHRRLWALGPVAVAGLSRASDAPVGKVASSARRPPATNRVVVLPARAGATGPGSPKSGAFLCSRAGARCWPESGKGHPVPPASAGDPPAATPGADKGVAAGLVPEEARRAAPALASWELPQH
jgi:hypothetical protein